MVMKRLWLILFCLLFPACGTIWTVGFMGATLSVQFPQPQQVKPEVTANVTTAPATQGVKP